MARSRSDLDIKEVDDSAVTVRYPEFGSVLAQINIGGDQGPIRRRLLVLVNPTMVQHAV